MILQSLYLIIGLFLLIVGSNYLLKSSVDLSLKYGISKVVIGLTVVSFATSAPELLISISSALKESSDISISNVIGSNIANIGLVFSTALSPILFGFLIDFGLSSFKILLYMLFYTLFSNLLLFTNPFNRCGVPFDKIANL